MTPEQWRRLRPLLEDALTQPATDRDGFLQRAGIHPDDREALARLLQAHDRAGDDDPPGLEAWAGPLLADPEPLEPGQALGPYRIGRCLGRGGMGVVYLAHDTRLGRDVALKLLAPAGRHDASQRERLRREARAAAAVSHPGIAQVHALEDDGHGGWYVVSEYVAGHSLRDEIVTGPLDPGTAVETALQIADAVGAAHARGIVHRDLKPENVMRGTDGRVKVLDFGLARLLDGPEARETRERLTVAGTVMGTPAYMAPEQLRGAEVGAATDIFALGVLLHEMLTGRHPFADDERGTTATMVRILEGAPEPLPDALARGCPDLAAIIARCLRKDPAERYQSMAEVVEALQSARHLPAAGPGRIDAVRPASPPVERPDAAAVDTDDSTRLWWWRFHQLAMVGTYAATLYPAWMLRTAPNRGLAHGLLVIALTIAATVAATLRLHWLFTARVLPRQLAGARRRARPWIHAADAVMCALLLAAALLALQGDRTALAAVLAGIGAGITAAARMIEPATTEAAFGPET